MIRSYKSYLETFVPKNVDVREATRRQRQIVEIDEMIKTADLPADYAHKLNDHVIWNFIEKYKKGLPALDVIDWGHIVNFSYGIPSTMTLTIEPFFRPAESEEGEMLLEYYWEMEKNQEKTQGIEKGVVKSAEDLWNFTEQNIIQKFLLPNIQS